MGNAVLAYTGNVCSTPMIEYARKVNEILVPVREEFDDYLFSRVVPEGSSIASYFSSVLTSLYRRETSEFFRRNSLADYRGSDVIPPVSEKSHILFKWRCFDGKIPDLQKISRVFVENEVVPVLMVRRSLVEQALKIFLSEKIYASRHQQFKVSALSEEDYARYLREQDGLRVRVGPEDLLEIRRISRMFLNRTRNLKLSMAALFPHVETPLLLVSEEIFNPLIDRGKFDAALSRIFGEEISIPDGHESEIRKGGLSTENCGNALEVSKDPVLIKLELEYRAVMSGLVRVFEGDPVPLHPVFFTSQFAQSGL